MAINATKKTKTMTKTVSQLALEASVGAKRKRLTPTCGECLNNGKASACKCCVHHPDQREQGVWEKFQPKMPN
jgi:hypothetical protein